MTDFSQRFAHFLARVKASANGASASTHGDDTSLDISGTRIFVSKDADGQRAVLWGQLSGLASNEGLAAAPIANEFNASYYHDKGVSMGISAASQTVIVGRSLEIDKTFDDLDALLTGFAGDLAVAQSYFDQKLVIRRNAERDAATADGGMLIRI